MGSRGSACTGGRDPQAPIQPSLTPAAPPPHTSDRLPDSTGIPDYLGPGSLAAPSPRGTDLGAAVSGAPLWSPANQPWALRTKETEDTGPLQARCLPCLGAVPSTSQRGSPGRWGNKGVKKDGVCSWWVGGPSGFHLPGQAIQEALECIQSRVGHPLPGGQDGNQKSGTGTGCPLEVVGRAAGNRTENVHRPWHSPSLTPESLGPQLPLTSQSSAPPQGSPARILPPGTLSL